MKCPVNTALAQRWQTDAEGGRAVHRWTRFLPMFQDHAHAWTAAAGLTVSVDEVALGRAFFGWQRIVDQSEEFALVNPLDHAHYVCGRLLRCLLRERLYQSSADVTVAASSDEDPMLQQWAAGYGLLSFVCTLLQSMRYAMGETELPWQEALYEHHWKSFRENVNEDADRAGPFLDFFTGLEPVWEFPTTPARRPGMQSKAKRD
jgi:hypothetical protein